MSQASQRPHGSGGVAADPIEFSGFFRYLRAVEGLSDLTLRWYRLDLRQALEAAGPPPPPRPSQSPAILAWARRVQMAWSEMGLKPATLNRKTATLKKWLGHLHFKGEIDTDLAAQLRCPRSTPRLPRFVSVDELESLLRTASGEGPDTRVSLLLLLLAGCGLRVSEACSLKWQDVDLSRCELRVTGKGEKTRVVPIPHRTLEALRHGRPTDWRATDSVWGANALTARAAHSLVRKAGVRSGLLRPLNPHALRHTYATLLLRGGASLRALQELLGHRSLEATSRYTHVQLDDLARTMQAHSPLRKR
jgi:integrase/recombinase XerC/integrase/recombinase XerD